MYKILIIEDDIKLRGLMQECLEKFGYAVEVVENFKEVEQHFDMCRPDLVLLDINLPYYDGFYLCRLFRRKSKAPLIIISARSGEMDQVMGIELGADDYVPKPFNIEIFLAKVMSALRRAYGEYSLEPDGKLKTGSLLLDENTFKITYGSKSAELSKNEYKLLRKLLECRNHIVSREVLLEELWDDHTFVDDNTLTVNVTRIKNILSTLGIRDAVKTKRGVGYILDTMQLEG